LAVAVFEVERRTCAAVRETLTFSHLHRRRGRLMAEAALRTALFNRTPGACGARGINDGHDTRSLQHYLGHKNIQRRPTGSRTSGGSSPRQPSDPQRQRRSAQSPAEKTASLPTSNASRWLFRVTCLVTTGGNH
jgi:hypothetical protein